MITLNLRFDEGLEHIPVADVGKVIEQLDKQTTIKIPTQAIINVRVVDQVKIRELNKKYGGKDEATDVLSFNYSEDYPKAQEGELGDVVVSYQHIKTQAKTAGTDEATELALLILHGILHVLGNDHQTKEQQEQMDKLQGDVMTAARLTYRDFGWTR